MPLDKKQLYSELVNDICAKDIPKYDKLAVFVYALLGEIVKCWCFNNSGLRNGISHEDVIQEIQIRIIKKCEDYFFKPVDGKTNKTCDEFSAWCFKVAKNYFRTYCLKPKKRKEVDSNSDVKIDNKAGNENSEDFIERREKQEENRNSLRNCFAVVMDLKSSLHIVLTWLAVSLFMIKYNMNKIESTHLVVKRFSEMMLDEMFDAVIDLIPNLKWLDIDEEQVKKQKKKLDDVNNDTGKRIGGMKYSEFYMKKGPEKSISDWVNRINEQIKKNVD